jgi:hypothetical protein
MCSYDDEDDQLLPDNISDEELERLERMEQQLATGTNEEISTPEVEVVSEAPAKKSGGKKAGSVGQI